MKYKYDECTAIPTKEIKDTIYEIINDSLNMSEFDY